MTRLPRLHPEVPTSAPAPYSGGKGSIAAEVWRRLGTGADRPNHVIVPFAGMLGVLRHRPDWRPGARLTETVNDADGLLVNALRSMALDEGAVIEALTIRIGDEGSGDATMWPTSEIDQRARAVWLIDHAGDIAERLADDPRWCDPEAAAWWLWGASNWIGSGWPSRARQSPDIAKRWGAGVMARDGVERVRRMARRLRHVRTLCGDWSRCVSAPSVLGQTAGSMGLAPCAVFLDPDYGEGDAYHATAGAGVEARRSVAGDVWAWAMDAGARWPTLRIAVSGYIVEGDDEGEAGPDGEPLPAGWGSLRWSTSNRARGAGRAVTGAARARADRECVWFSPGCLTPAAALQQVGLFARAGVEPTSGNSRCEGRSDARGRP